MQIASDNLLPKVESMLGNKVREDIKLAIVLLVEQKMGPVLIKYGNFSNAALLFDFGFTLPDNIHNQVEIQVNIPHHDFLREMKLEILQGQCRPNIKDASGFKSTRSFVIKEVKSATGRGKGLPQSLRAFTRVLCCASPQDLSDLVMEAAQNDGQLARRALKDISREKRAHEIVL